MRSGLVLTIVAFASLMLAFATLRSPDVSRDVSRPDAQPLPLPRIGPAPEFALISQDGAPVRLADFRGKVLAVTFIYTLCSSTCPVLTPLMARVQDEVGSEFGRNIAFASITVDPERDTAETLKLYAQSYGADLAGWSFLTGPATTIQEVTRRYGVFAAPAGNGDIDHTFLTSLVDRNGMLRVQYLGVRFDPDEFRRDLLSLAREQ
jgi:protein SCO1